MAEQTSLAALRGSLRRREAAMFLKAVDLIDDPSGTCCVRRVIGALSQSDKGCSQKEKECRVQALIVEASVLASLDPIGEELPSSPAVAFRALLKVAADALRLLRCDVVAVADLDVVRDSLAGALAHPALASFRETKMVPDVKVPWFLWSIVWPLNRSYSEKDIRAQPVREFPSQET